MVRNIQMQLIFKLCNRTETGIVSYKINIKYFNFPTVFRSKNPYSKKSIEHERFENWQKTVVRK